MLFFCWIDISPYDDDDDDIIHCTLYTVTSDMVVIIIDIFPIKKWKVRKIMINHTH